MGSNLVEELVVELGAFASFGGVGDVLAKVVDGDAGSDLVHGSGGADGVGDFFAGDEAGGDALSDAGTFCNGAQGAAFGESDEGGSQHAAPDSCSPDCWGSKLPEMIINLD